MSFELKKKGDKKKEQFIQWTREQEELLAEWAEKGSCYRWLHGRSEKKYRCRNYTFTIPVIILSTLTGTANFAMDSFVPEEKKQYASAGVGSVNIIAGILSTLQNFLRYAELMESHRAAGVSWSKLSRDITVELALDPKRRKPAGDFLNICRAEYDRLIEQSPMVDDSILKQFHDKFHDSDINKPEMCNGLDKCEIYVPPPSKEEKVSNIVMNVAEKLNNNHWDHVKKEVHKHHLVDPVKFKPHESKNELDSLGKIGRVSSLKKAMHNEGDSVIDEIKKKVPVNNDINNGDDVNNGDDANNDENNITKEIQEDEDTKLDNLLDEATEFLDGITDNTNDIENP